MSRFLFLVLALCCTAALAENASKPLGEPALDPSTMHSLGVYWIISGDDNANAAIEADVRKKGAAEWSKIMPLVRVEKGAHKTEKYGSKVNVPDAAWLFAGSALLLAPDTSYEIRLKLNDADGGNAEKILEAKTIAEPLLPAGMTEVHVVPGGGGGTGTAADPYKGLNAAQDSAKPGDLFLLHAGTYAGTFMIKKSGEPGKPIVWRAAGDGDVVLDAKGKTDKLPVKGIDANDAHDVWFENLDIRNATYGMTAQDAHHLVIRRCHIHRIEYGIAITRNDRDTVRGMFIADNTLEGPSVWPRTKGIENARGIQITGAGHEVCFNRIRGFADAMDTFPSPQCVAIDFHNNDCSECTDDGMEMDYSEHNTRSFNNRFTNIFQGISVQPVFGGPVYIFRNALYNIGLEPFKMHNSPSGALMFHNTCVKKGMPAMVMTEEKVRNCVFRNNLFIGTDANYAFEFMAPAEHCDFDYDGIGGGPWKLFMKWSGERYATLDELKAKGPIYKHAVLVDPASAFASGILPPEDEKKQQLLTANDLRLKAGSAAIDAGEVLPGINDGFSGKAPDLGAYELGAELPHYGPRPEKK